MLQRARCNITEHGLLGGLLFYDNLYKLGKVEKGKCRWYLGEDWIVHGAHVADSIAAHNLWHKENQEIAQLKIGSMYERN